MPLRRLRPLLDRLARRRPLAVGEVSVVFLGPRAMARANRQFLGHEGPTDVITFEHGEILVCPEIAREQARARRLPVGEELLRYIVHGWLHLCGYDDARAPDRRRMHVAQERLVTELMPRRADSKMPVAERRPCSRTRQRLAAIRPGRPAEFSQSGGARRQAGVRGMGANIQSDSASP